VIALTNVPASQKTIAVGIYAVTSGRSCDNSTGISSVAATQTMSMSISK
jgi:hypothetical protein